MGPTGNFSRRPIEVHQAVLSGATLAASRKPIRVGPWDEFVDLTYPSALGMPSDIYFNATYPLGTLAVNPTPNSSWNLLIYGIFPWPSVLPSDTVSLPPGYDAAIVDNLAVKLAGNYQLPMTTQLQSLVNRARDGKSGIIQAIPTKDRVKDNALAAQFPRNVRNWITDTSR
jgi:hypothetical protein